MLSIIYDEEDRLSGMILRNVRRVAAYEPSAQELLVLRIGLDEARLAQMEARRRLVS